jgi:SpoVK/Ycf46/Vps4 family AAA+-type ATPase
MNTRQTKRKRLSTVVTSKKKQKVENRPYISIHDLLSPSSSTITLTDIIKTCELFEKKSKTNHNSTLERLCDVLDDLIELNNMIGLDSIKLTFVHHLLYMIQDLNSTSEMNHIAIYGGAGHGKTALARLFGRILSGIGVVSHGNFITATRSDLIGDHLGSTALKTDEVLRNCYGNVLFLDEIYSFGCEDKRDSFSKECIDTLNLFLSEHGDNFICIVAGYEHEVQQCFFSLNKGLERRFPWKYYIEEYTIEHLKQIFIKQVYDSSWTLASHSDLNAYFTEDHKHLFEFSGGDTDIFLSRCKMEHSVRMFLSSTNHYKCLNSQDLMNGFQKFKEYKCRKHRNEIPNMMYL